MEGVEILSSIEVAIEHAFNWGVFWVVGIVILGIFIATGVALYKGGDFEVGIIFSFCFIGIFAGTMFGYLLGESLGRPTKYATEYKVIICDEVSMNEFNERYEIINQEGRIFTVRERNWCEDFIEEQTISKE